MAAFAAIKRVAKLGTKSATTALTGFGSSKNFPFISGYKHFSHQEEKSANKLRSTALDDYCFKVKQMQRETMAGIESFKKVLIICSIGSGVAAYAFVVGAVLLMEIEEKKKMKQ